MLETRHNGQWETLSSKEIVVDGEKIGEIDLFTLPDGKTKVANVWIKEEFQRKGHGRDLYIQLGNALAAEGRTLRSGNTSTEAAVRLWDSLERDGYARRVSDTKSALGHVWEFVATPETHERVLTVVEVEESLRRFAEAGGVETARKEDERGLYLLEWAVSGEGGEKSEFAYRRSGAFKEFQTAVTTIEAVYYDADGIPCGGRTIANFVGGKWREQR